MCSSDLSDLANVLGNLLNRTLNMAKKYLDGKIQDTSFDDSLAAELRSAVEALPQLTKDALQTYQIHKALAAAWDVLNLANTYVEKTAPFKLAKDPANAPQVAAIMRNLAETILHVSIMISPVVPKAARNIQKQLGWESDRGMTLADLHWGLLRPGHQLGIGVPLFPRVEVEG